MGALSKKEVFELLDYFHSQGGNFIDTANNYQSEQSEQWIGEWLNSKPNLRDQMVVAYVFQLQTAVVPTARLLAV